MKRKFALLMAVMLAVSMLAACAQQPSPDPATPDLSEDLKKVQDDLAASQKALEEANGKIQELEAGAAETPEFDPNDFREWYMESKIWMTVNNGAWSQNAADKISDEELTKAFKMAVTQQNAVHWTPYFFIAVKDVEEQRKLIGDGWGDPNDMATEGTVTILVLADQILTMDEGHVSEYEGTYMPTDFARYDTGMASSTLQMALATMGYYTHYFGSINGEYSPVDIAEKYQSMDRYVKDEYVRAWGFRSPLDGPLDEQFVYPVKGNCVFVCAIVVGKPAEGTTVETWGTNHARPDNWAIWD